MGVINDGKISGTLPRLEAFSVHYPGYPSTTARFIETLGGTEGILKARGSQSNKLELHFRPEDPYSHPVFGELNRCNNFLLKISRIKFPKDQGAEVNESPIKQANDLRNGEELSNSGISTTASSKEVEAALVPEHQPNLCADIVARVSEAYHFDGMADYQHVLAVHANVARRKRNFSELADPFSEKGSFMDVDQDNIMLLLPPLFAPKDVPENLVLKLPANLGTKRKQEGVTQSYCEIDMEPSLAIDFQIKDLVWSIIKHKRIVLCHEVSSHFISVSVSALPLFKIPKKVNWEESITRGSELWEWQILVSKLFDERPIWPKESLTELLLDKGLKFSHVMLKRLLLGVAYYFSNGPFMKFWIKKGYDPRTDPDSRIYQRTEFRVPEALRNHVNTDTGNNLIPRREDLCSFHVFPSKSQTFLQLFELDDEYIQQEIRKPAKRTTCDVRTGWFSECMLDCLRVRVAMKFLSIYPKTGAEKILKACSDEFEKLKRACIYKDLNPDHEEQQSNKEPVLDQEKEKLKSSNDDEVDEINVDDAEELDAYETGDPAGDYYETFLLADSHMENNSKRYLQDLFGSFPSTAVGEDNSDEEYQIYEQYSSDEADYSDDGS